MRNNFEITITKFPSLHVFQVFMAQITTTFRHAYFYSFFVFFSKEKNFPTLPLRLTGKNKSSTGLGSSDFR